MVVTFPLRNLSAADLSEAEQVWLSEQIRCHIERLNIMRQKLADDLSARADGSPYPTAIDTQSGRQEGRVLTSGPHSSTMAADIGGLASTAIALAAASQKSFQADGCLSVIKQPIVQHKITAANPIFDVAGRWLDSWKAHPPTVPNIAIHASLMGGFGTAFAVIVLAWGIWAWISMRF